MVLDSGHSRQGSQASISDISSPLAAVGTDGFILTQSEQETYNARS